MSFITRATLCKRSISCHRVSVRPFVTSRCSTNAAKCRITQIGLMRHGSPWTLVFCDTKDLIEIPIGSSLTRAPNGGGVGKNCVLSTGRKVSGSDVLPPQICVHSPRSSMSTTLRWQRNTRCRQQL